MPDNALEVDNDNVNDNDKDNSNGNDNDNDNDYYSKDNSPASVSCQTMPSRLTAVPGSQGPNHSGSVSVAASVEVPASTWGFLS